MAKFIKRLGDERVSCQVMISVKQFLVRGGGAPRRDSSEQEKLFALQILRGPLRSETKELSLPTDGREISMPIDLVFSRSTTMYRLVDSTFQRKTALIRLLEITDVTEQEQSKRKAKIIGEIAFDLSDYVGEGLIEKNYPFQSHLAPEGSSVVVALEVKQLEQEAGERNMELLSTLARSRDILTAYAGGTRNVSN